jgi:PAS domain S-box-containing protein
MTLVVPNNTTGTKPSRLFQDLSDLLLSGLEFLGASAGWIGLQEAGGLTFPVRVGVSSDAWLPWQQAQGSVWGFTITDETTVFNDLSVASKGEVPSLYNLLSCPLIHEKQILGHVALTNKAQGFKTEDAIVLRGMAQHILRLLSRQRLLKQSPIEIPAAWRLLLDRSAEGILLLDESGTLVYANAAWLDWTGFSVEQLLGRTAPFPFWVSQHDLVQTLSKAPACSAGSLPFRRHDQSLFWCVVETSMQPWDDRLLTISFLRQLPAPSPSEAVPTLPGVLEDKRIEVRDPIAAEKLSLVRSPSLNWLPLVFDLDRGVEGWESRWEERTGLSVCDVEGSRCELVLDWLFPQQQDRNRVADCFHHPHSTAWQLILDVIAPNGSRPRLCTFLPLPSRAAAAGLRRWLLLVGEGERAAEPEILDGTTRDEPTARIASPRT